MNFTYNLLINKNFTIFFDKKKEIIYDRLDKHKIIRKVDYYEKI